MAIHQTNQIWLYDAGCFRVATGVMVTLDSGRICINNATPGASYVLSVKYQPKSILGSTFSGVSPLVMYGFESNINGTLLLGSQASILLNANCNGGGYTNFWRPGIAQNPTTDNFILNVTTDEIGPVIVRIIDVLGRVMDRFEMQPNTQMLKGRNLKRGVYFIEFVQGQNRKVLKGEKL